MHIFLARQPIFDRRQEVFGYELLYRCSRQNVFPGTDGDRATLEVIRNSLLIIGAEQVTGGRRAFINFTRRLLLNGTAHYLPKGLAVVEIVEDTKADAAIIKACQHLKQSGYLLALDDFVWPEHANHPLLDLVDFIKVDVQQNTPTALKHLMARLAALPVKLVAEKTATRRQFEDALALGFHYFQGYFFSEPVIIAHKDLTGSRLAYLGLLRELSRKNLDFRALEKVIQRDTAISFKLLKYLNSAFFGFRHEITSIRHGLQLLGETEIRKWAALVTLMELSRGKPPELLRLSLLRAKFYEALAAEAGLESHKSELFLLGMFSLMDTFVGRPLPELLADLPLSDQVRQALLGQDSPYRFIFDLGLSYEQGQWAQVSALAQQTGIPEHHLPDLYADAIRWVESPFWF